MDGRQARSAPGPQSQRLRALTRSAYLATAGHLDLDDEFGPGEADGASFRGTDGDPWGEHPPGGARTGGTEAGRGIAAGGVRVRRTGRRRRWAVPSRAALVTAVVVLLLAAVLGARALVVSPGEPVPLPATVTSGDDGEPGGGPAADASAPANDAALVPGAATGVPGASTDPAPSAAATPDVVVVHVAGSVVRPGVVSLTVGARVADAVHAAGGAGPDAELGAVNLARVLLDGEQVYVPAVGELAPGAAAGAGPAPGGGGGGAGSGPAAGGGGAVVDLNTAGLAELDTLPGVGPAIAQRILDWREENGPFLDVDELLEVSGIGPTTLERLREQVRT